MDTRFGNPREVQDSKLTVSGQWDVGTAIPIYGMKQTLNECAATARNPLPKRASFGKRESVSPMVR